MAAAPMQRVAIHAIGDTQLSSKSLVIGTPKPKMTLAMSKELCAAMRWELRGVD